MSKLKERLLFFTQFLTHWREIGSITPTSKYLVNKILSHIDFSNNCTILELGPGTGVFTRVILQRINSGSKLISIEINHKFQEQLSQINDSRFNLIRGSAENIETLVNEKVDYIVSGLPFASLPKSIKDAILKQILKKVDQDTVFLQYQYFITNYFDLIKYFKVMMGFTFLNIPPAVYYRCRAK